MTVYYAAVAVLAVLNLASIVLCLLMGMRLQRLERELLPGRIASPQSAAPTETPVAPPPPRAEAPPDKFSAALLGGEMNLRLNQEREQREPPEKYRYISGLAEQGMPAAEIARVLHLAPGEVEQLLTLARLGKGDA